MNIETVVVQVSRYPKNMAACYTLWLPDDVISRAKERGISLTVDDAASILDAMQHHHDASVGMNWDVMDVHIDSLSTAVAGA